MLALGTEREFRFLALSLSPLRLSTADTYHPNSGHLVSRQTVDLFPIPHAGVGIRPQTSASSA